MSEDIEEAIEAPEPENIANWYGTLSAVPHEEKRRLVCLHIALAAEAEPKTVVPLARLIELFLMGHGDGVEAMMPKVKVN